MNNSNLMASSEFNVRDEKSPVQARIFVPAWSDTHSAWGCRFEIDQPIGVEQTVFGQTSLQALSLALKLLSSSLYGSELYKQGRLGEFGEFGGYLGIPAATEFLDQAPFPF